MSNEVDEASQGVSRDTSGVSIVAWNYSGVKRIVNVSKALDPVVKYELERAVDCYDLYINGRIIGELDKYSEIVSKSRPETYEQVLIGEVLEVLDIANVPFPLTPQPHILSKKVYDDLRSTFKRSRRAGEAKALALAKKLYLDDFNRMMQNHTWVNSGSSGVLGNKLLESKRRDNYYWLRFSDGVDSITIRCCAFLDEYFSLFWYLRTGRIEQFISGVADNTEVLKVSSSIRGVEEETLLKALEVALRCDTTLGAALFLTARE